jgi:hypothetical protein
LPDVEGPATLEMNCAVIVDNQCRREELLVVCAVVQITRCIFRANAFGGFIGTGNRAAAKLTQCVFDFEFNKVGIGTSVQCVTEACVRRTDRTFLQQCRTRTVPPPATTKSRPNSGRIIGIVAECVAAVLVIAAIAFVIYTRHSKQELVYETPSNNDIPASYEWRA